MNRSTGPVVAVIGDPIGHSLSPVMHNAAFRAAGLDWSMVAVQVVAGTGATAVDRVRSGEFAGLAVTMPLKVEVAHAVDELDAAAARFQSVNTVVRGTDDRLVGMSTDGGGFVDSLGAAGVSVAGAKVHVVGAGAAARSIIAALGESGASVISISNRSFAGAEHAATLHESAVAVDGPGAQSAVREADVVVNATSVGMGVHSSDQVLPIEVALISSHQVVADIVYHPLETGLLAAARLRGATVVDGLGMLVYQAARQSFAWTGIRPDPAAMRRAAETELAQRAG